MEEPFDLVDLTKLHELGYVDLKVADPDGRQEEADVAHVSQVILAFSLSWELTDDRQAGVDPEQKKSYTL